MLTDINNLELFIDDFVAPPNKVPTSGSSGNWTKVHPYENGNSVSNNQAFTGASNIGQYNGNFALMQQMQQPCTGTEIWGEKSSGNEWRSAEQKRSLLEESGYRPVVQSRSPEWSQQTAQQPQHLHMASHGNMNCFAESPPLHPANQIQDFVSDLIRHNNMYKPYNLPPWIDTSKPPPPLPDCIPTSRVQIRAQMQQVSNQHQGNVALIPSTNFQQPSIHDMSLRGNDVVNVPTLVRQQQAFPRVQYAERMPNVNLAMAKKQQSQYGLDEMYQPYSVPTSVAPNQNITQQELQNNNAFYGSEPANFLPAEGSKMQADLQQSKPKAEEPVQSPPPQQLPSLTSSQAVFGQTRSVERTAPPQAANEHSAEGNTIKANANQCATNDVSLTSAVEKDVASKIQPYQTSQFNKKRVYTRQPSAADLDLDWRRRDSSEEPTPQLRNGSGDAGRRTSLESKPTKNLSRTLSWERRGAGDADDEVFKLSSSDRNSQLVFPSQSKKDDNKRVDVENDRLRHVTEKSKFKLKSWLQQNNETSAEDAVGRDIRHLQISDSENDFSKFIEATQSFATNEAKMREVAEILCNKALNDPRLARNVSVLCDRLSFMMVHGTKFRNVVLNVMQGHYKNRDQLFAASFRSDKRWFGFVTFLVEIFLNVRTSTRERLLVLTTPVFCCLFQVLDGEKTNQEHIECFGRVFKQVCPALESECPSRLDKLMEEVRDRCVLSKTSFVKRVLLHCVEFYASKWETVPS